MKAIFLDRDGTIIIDKHYMHKAEDLEYYPDSFNAMRQLQNLGYEIFMVTNQSGVGRGYFQIEDVYKVHEQMQKDMTKHGLKPYKDIAISAHHPDDNSAYRKPGPQMILDLAHKWDIDLTQSYMLGDKLSDAQAGENAKCHGVLVRKESLKQHLEFPYYQTLEEFTQSIAVVD